MSEGFWKRKEAPGQPHQERWRPPLTMFVGDEDDDHEADLAQLLAAQGYMAPPKRFWQRIWPPWGS
jgi:hypothetical protein